MADLPVLTDVEARILGSLLEKEVTVPATYPLTLNALRAACNQTSSRDPVVEYDDKLLEETTRALKQRGLLRIVWADKGPRTLKYHQVLAELLELAGDERALLTVLLLRGPQAPGELKTRTDRLHAFGDRHEVELCLARLAARAVPVVEELPRRPGDRDARWRHLLGEPEAPDSSAAAPASAAVDPAGRDDRVRASYDVMAARYAEGAAANDAGHPFDRWLLGHLVSLVGPGAVVEVGCGSGQVAALLAELGADASGIDLSPAMVEEARRRFPHLRFEVGDLRSLLRPVAAEGWGAVVAWYSLVHFAPTELGEVVAGLVRPLRPGGWLLAASHAGTGVRHVEEWFGEPVDLDFVRHEPTALAAAFSAAGLTDVTWYRRGPVAALEETTERGYVLGRRPT
ncbi:MAG TPA: DUF480 domain-containing protein [Nocardioidaceae bacterium]|nr:DUF480 domain-containing protein [Nocardioidaceae bacterium]